MYFEKHNGDLLMSRLNSLFDISNNQTSPVQLASGCVLPCVQKQNVLKTVQLRMCSSGDSLINN